MNYVLSGHLKIVFKTIVKTVAECSKMSILQYFRPSSSYHLPLIPLFCLFLSGRLRHVLLYNALELYTASLLVDSETNYDGTEPGDLIRAPYGNYV